ncbi:MAG TPA: methyltransferase domain-containing protein [Candidatus Dormibacteraeota bacterium]|jgi:2-polyprenyl-3-methyl-5-hydroxy-6-metoxy-1,4-benzoquinol methylase|nr:methyltransferase domain-containing protein [Candidatus Dormibacteraeota bacterium]
MSGVETAVDNGRIEQLMGRLIGYMTGSTMCLSIWIGDELGLYRVMAGAGSLSSDAIAERAGCHPRLVREWLDGQVAGGLLVRDDAADTYALGAEEAMAFADDTTPIFVARAMNAIGSMYMDIDRVTDAFRGDGAIPWGDHHPCLFKGTEWFFRTGYRAYLPAEWIPALDGVLAKLDAGARVADVGCGHGASAVVMAEAYPNSHITGFDFHQPSIATARERAREAGVADRTTFEVATSKDYGGTFDLICFFDCLHDMGDPVGIARHARERLEPDGTVLLVEPFAIDGRAANIAGNPMAALLYTASTVVCTPNSLSQEVGLGLGAQAGEARLRQVFEEAGFTRFRRAAETPLNLILEARP